MSSSRNKPHAPYQGLPVFHHKIMKIPFDLFPVLQGIQHVIARIEQPDSKGQGDIPDPSGI